MPIGTIIGWLIGQLLAGLIMSFANRKFVFQKSDIDSLMSQIFWIFGNLLWMTALFALIGTFFPLLIGYAI